MPHCWQAYPGIYEPFATGRCQQVQDDALRYLHTYYGAQITTTASLL